MPDVELGWLEEALASDAVVAAAEAGDTRLVRAALGLPLGDADHHAWVASVLEALAWDELVADSTSKLSTRLSRQAFKIGRGLLSGDGPLDGPIYDMDGHELVLRIACLAWLGDETSLAQRLLNDLQLGDPLGTDLDWGSRARATSISMWLLVLRKRDWHDIDEIARLHDQLQLLKASEERMYVFGDGVDGVAQGDSAARSRAWTMVSHYHLASACWKLAEYLVTGFIAGPTRDSYDPRSDVESALEKARAAASAAGAPALEQIARLLGLVGRRMLENSIWSVARGANPLTQRFVQTLVDRTRTKPLLELLPPQRQALAGAGLARGGKRSVVVSMPTSSGKTLIAEFRILEAINAFRERSPWVVYVAPSRALVNQVTRRLRRDFAPLDIRVEQVSPALEVDGAEEAMLLDADTDKAFHVLVATPEKLDLLLRSNWASRVGRPLTLVVIDEAHTIEQSVRGIRLELLLATINREVRDAQFLLLTPFIENAERIAAWLDPASHDGVTLELDWSPNDRLIGLAERERGARRGDFAIRLRTLHTTRETLDSVDDYGVGGNRPLGLTWTKAGAVGQLAAATAYALQERGTTITIVQKPSFTWPVARTLSQAAPATGGSLDLSATLAVVADELGAEHPLVEFLSCGVGVHHAGLSPELRVLIEWLTESGGLSHLVATTTIAAGVNFPVANVVLASHQYPYGQDMGASEFWNLAGRAGRVDQGKVGVVALAAESDRRSEILEAFVARQVTDLNSSLVGMVKSALATAGNLDLRALSYRDEWSAFVQFLSHSYRQLGNPALFAQEAEVLLRGTLGFQELHAESAQMALELLRAVREYGQRLHGQPLALVDATGFSLESVAGALARLRDAAVTDETWSGDLFGADRAQLASAMGVMLEIPELRENLIDEVGGKRKPGQFLADVVSAWVNGASLREIADAFYAKPNEDPISSITRAAQRIFRNIAPTVAWGLSAMQSLTLRDGIDGAPSEQRNIPAYAFYGVSSGAEVALRLVGVPRAVAGQLRTSLELPPEPLSPHDVRARLQGLSTERWTAALGERGASYQRAWAILDGTG